MIPESFIQELLNRVDVVDIIDKKVQLKKAGANFVACCPFHQEKSPSFTVSPSKQFYHCFGCGEHGSAISFLIEYDGLSFVEAVSELANTIGLKVPNEDFSEKINVNENIKLEEALKIANNFYQVQLRKSPKAIAYLKSRGLSGEIAKEFSIGYAPEGWQNLETAFKNYQDQVLINAGLIQKNEQGRYYDRFRNRIMFPIHNAKGIVVGFGGRVINPEDTPKYYNSPETALFQKSYELYGLLAARKTIRDTGYVVVVEGYMDVVALAQHGIGNSVATLGTATTLFHIKKLTRYTDEIIFCFDGDNAGRTAAWRAMNNSLSAVTDKTQLKFLFLPNQHDPDSFVRENSNDAFRALAKEAIPLTEYIIKYLTQDNDLASQESKVKFLNELEPIIKQFSANKLLLLFKKRIAQLVDLDIQEIDQIFKIKFTKEVIKNTVHKSNRIPMSTTRRYCLFIILEPSIADIADKEMFLTEKIDDQIARVIIEISIGENKKNTASIMHILSSRFDQEIISQLQTELALFDQTMDISQEVDALRFSIKKKHSSVSKKIVLNQLKQKSLQSLTEEEKKFLRNMGKG
jgi:DNA primase